MEKINFSKLKEPFDEKDIEWRLQSCGEKNGKVWGVCLAYVTNRAIQNRLDEVVGPENWKNEFKEGPDGGILCGISIKCNDEWVTKWDGAENTQIEAVKGGLSGAMKRSASTGWGIGRYLYYLDEGFATISDSGKFSGKTKEGKWFKWNPPKLPTWALPKGTSSAAEKEHEKELQKSESTANSPVQPVDSEVSKAIETVQGYINSGSLDKGFALKAQDYIEKRDLDGLKRVISYMDAQLLKEQEAMA